MNAPRARSVWVVVLSWYGCADTLELLDGLTQSPCEVLVVDNGSFDGTLEAVTARFPDVHLLQTGSNLGYAGGNNRGLTYALGAGADVVVILNNDTLVEPDFLTPLLAELDLAPRRAVSPDIRYADQPADSWFRGGAVERSRGWLRHLTPAEQPLGIDTFETPWLAGCCLGATADTWRLVGLFDEDLFLLFEDADWSLRAKALEVTLLVVPQSQVLHKVSRSFTGEVGYLGHYYFARNGTVFAYRYLGAASALRFVWHHLLRPGAANLVRRRPCGSVTMHAIGLVDATRRKRGRIGRFGASTATRLQAR